MAENEPAAYRAICYSAAGHASRKELFATEDEAKAWAQAHIKGFDKVVVERRDGDKWEIVAGFSHR